MVKIVKLYYLCCVAIFTISSPAFASDTFHPTVDGHPMDTCYSWGADCNGTAALLFCQAQGYDDFDDFSITYDSPPSATYSDHRLCTESYCDHFASIVCYGGGSDTCSDQIPDYVSQCIVASNVQCDAQCENCTCKDPCYQQRQDKVSECGSADNVQCDDSCNCICKPPPEQCASQKQDKATECGSADNVQCDDSCNCICKPPPEQCASQKQDKATECGSVDNVQCDNSCNCTCKQCADQKQAKIEDCVVLDNVQCDDACNCICKDQCYQSRQDKVEECGTIDNVRCDQNCICACKIPPPVSYWLMATRSECSAATNICGKLLSKYGSVSDDNLIITSPPVIPCDPASTSSISGAESRVGVDQPLYQIAYSAAAGGDWYYGGFSLPAAGTGFYVFSWDRKEKGWKYLNSITVNALVNTIALTACNVQAPNGCRNSFRFSCGAPSDSIVPEEVGGGACAGKGDPEKTCLGAGGIVWDDKSQCKYHCVDCQGQYSDFVNTCVDGTLAQYGDISTCKYYCDCNKTTQQRNANCPFGATVNKTTCEYSCTPCYQLEYKCKTDCQSQYGTDPVINTCQESSMGAPYQHECKCPAAGPQGGGGTGTGGTGGTGTGTGTGGTDDGTGTGGTDDGTGTDCPECEILKQIKSDTGSIVRQGNDQYNLMNNQINRLGEIYTLEKEHYFNQEHTLSQILEAITSGGTGTGGTGTGGAGSTCSCTVDLSSVVDAINGLHDFFNTLHDDIGSLKTDLHSALYDGDTPYQAEMLSELRRLTKGLLETSSGAEANSFISKFQALTYMENGEWVLRTSSQESSGWEDLLALLTSFFAGSSPDIPEFDDFQLTALSAHAEPDYQASQSLQMIDIQAAATASASRYESLPHPVVSVLDPQPCIYGASGLSICFNTEQWQLVYASLQYFGYFLAHLSVWVLVYRARTGLSSGSSED